MTRSLGLMPPKHGTQRLKLNETDIHSRNELKIGVRGDQGQVIFQRVGGNPIIRVRYRDPTFSQFGSNPCVNQGSRFARIEAFETREKLLCFQNSIGRGICVELAVKKLSGDVTADQRRIVPDGKRLNSWMAPTQQFDRTGIKEYGHGFQLRCGSRASARG
jgi:hypothetical protein